MVSRAGSDPRRPVGRLLTAMVTPFDSNRALDLAAAADLADYLVTEQRNDALVINGTTGEAPTTSDAEKADLVRAVVDAVDGRALVVAGVGTFDTAHTIHLADQAAKAGADALLVVTPYYSKPPQAGLLAHFRAVADASELPVVLYDIPARTGTPIQPETMIALAGHERIVAVKDAKGDLTASGRVMAETDLAYYSGDDAITLPLLSIGGVGVIGTSTHFSGAGTPKHSEAPCSNAFRWAASVRRKMLRTRSAFLRRMPRPTSPVPHCTSTAACTWRNRVRHSGSKGMLQ